MKLIKQILVKRLIFFSDKKSRKLIDVQIDCILTMNLFLDVALTACTVDT